MNCLRLIIAYSSMAYYNCKLSITDVQGKAHCNTFLSLFSSKQCHAIRTSWMLDRNSLGSWWRAICHRHNNNVLKMPSQNCSTHNVFIIVHSRWWERLVNKTINIISNDYNLILCSFCFCFCYFVDDVLILIYVVFCFLFLIFGMPRWSFS